jgi:hypothetical protein
MMKWMDLDDIEMVVGWKWSGRLDVGKWRKKKKWEVGGGEIIWLAAEGC